MAALSGSGLWAFQCIDLNPDGKRRFQSTIAASLWVKRNKWTGHTLLEHNMTVFLRGRLLEGSAVILEGNSVLVSYRLTVAGGGEIKIDY